MCLKLSNEFAICGFPPHLVLVKGSASRTVLMAEPRGCTCTCRLPSVRCLRLDNLSLASAAIMNTY